MTIPDATMKMMETITRRERQLTDTIGWNVKAPENAFLIAESQQSAVYERESSLELRNGTLVDANGRPMLGFARPGAPMETLRANAADIALGFTESMRVMGDGSVVYERPEIDPQTGDVQTHMQTIGKLALARFPASAKAESPGVVPLTGTPGDGRFNTIPAAARNQERIDTGFERLQDAYLAFDALRAAHKAHGAVEKTAMDLLK